MKTIAILVVFSLSAFSSARAVAFYRVVPDQPIVAWSDENEGAICNNAIVVRAAVLIITKDCKGSDPLAETYSIPVADIKRIHAYSGPQYGVGTKIEDITVTATNGRVITQLSKRNGAAPVRDTLEAVEVKFFPARGANLTAVRDQAYKKLCALIGQRIE